MKRQKIKVIKISPYSRQPFYFVCSSAGRYLFLTREPKNTFTPVTAENGTTTNTWEDNADVESVSSPSAPQNDTQVTGTKTDNTQTVVSEDASGTVTELSGSTTKDEIEETVPLENRKPMTIPPIRRNNPNMTTAFLPLLIPPNHLLMISRITLLLPKLLPTLIPVRCMTRYLDGSLPVIPIRTM